MSSMMLLLLSCFFFIGTCHAFLPVVLWHGMGDSCCQYGSLGRIITILKAKMPDTTILSLKFGEHFWEDIESSYFLNVNKQVELACKEISSHGEFQNGYNAVGFSQGGQFLRAVAQRCPDPPMRNLISLGGQHQGVYGLPNCDEQSSICNYVRKILNNGAYLDWVQNSLVQAEYWHDPLNEDAYREHSVFLADINNEKDVQNASYIENLQKLQTLVLVMFENDTMVTPKESSWFGFYRPGQSEEVLPYNQTHLYEKDLIGLRKLVNGGKVDFLSVEGNHLQFTEDWFIENIVKRYLM